MTEAADVVRNALLRDGVRLLCFGHETKVGKEDVQVRLHLESHGRSCGEPVDELLVAVGRAPNVDSLNLVAADARED